MNVIKVMSLVLCVASLAMAHDHTKLFDKCAVTGCVACEPSENIEDGNAKSIGVWLQPTYRNYSLEESGIPGFFPGHEGERPHKQGLGVDHTELYWSGTKNDQLRGSAVIAIAEHDGETEIEFEEAYIETLNNYLLPEGVNIKLGRAFWTLGSLNAQHAHSDSFADRPLPYRVFLDKAFNDDGAEISYRFQNAGVYTELGLGSFRGNDFPFGGVEEGQEENNASSAYIRAGKTIDENSSLRVGAYMLAGTVGERTVSHEHGTEPESFSFAGDSDLFIYDIRYSYKKLVLSAEYFSRTEDGTLTITEGSDPSEEFPMDDVDSSGWYVSGVYEINPSMRAGVRYSKLGSPDMTPVLGTDHTGQNPNGYDPTAIAYMIDWNHSENSLIRFQLNQEEMTDGEEDDQFIVQYIMNLQIQI